LRIVAALSLAACLVGALALSPDSGLTMGDSRFVVTPFARAWLIGASGAFLFMHLLGMVTAWQRNVPLVMLAALGTSAVALSSTDANGAFLMAGAGAMVAVLGGLIVPIGMPAVRVAVDGFRVAAVGAGAGVLAVGWVEAGGPSRAPEPILVGIVLVSIALALRLGAFPFHTVAARLTQNAPLVAVPILLAWMPALFGEVALGWQENRVVPLGIEGGLVGGIVVAVALLTIAATGIAGALADDVAQLVAYSTVQDAAFVLLAVGAPADVSTLVRSWLVLFVLAKSAAFALALALSAAFHTRAMSDLGGWARRSPPLALALLAIALATYGVPGLLPFDVRERLMRSSLGAFTPLGVAVSLLPLLGLVRLALIGLRRPGPTVRRGFGSRPVPVPFARPARVLRERGAESTWGRAMQLLFDVGREVRHAFVYLRVGWRLNRAPAAGVLVLVLSLLPMLLAVGVTDLRVVASGNLPVGIVEATEPAAP
jgi:proton-conducting membrane transporter